MEERKEEINELTFDLTTKNLGKAEITKFLLSFIFLWLNSSEDDLVLICRSFRILLQWTLIILKISNFQHSGFPEFLFSLFWFIIENEWEWEKIFYLSKLEMGVRELTFFTETTRRRGSWWLKLRCLKKALNRIQWPSAENRKRTGCS